MISFQASWSLFAARVTSAMTDGSSRMTGLGSHLPLLVLNTSEDGTLFLIPRAAHTNEAGRPVPRRDGIVPRRDGTVPRRDGTVPRRDGTVPRRDGTVPRRDGIASRRDGIAPRASFRAAPLAVFPYTERAV